MPEEFESELKRFQNEIAAIKQAEEEGSGEAHFRGEEFHPEELNESDMAMWQKVQDGTITREDITAYRAKLSSEEISGSRRLFEGFIMNKAVPAITRREHPELYKDEV